MSTTRKTKRAKTKKDTAQRQDSPFADDGRVYYTTTRGVVVECLGIYEEIQAQEENIRAQVEWPEAPTYTFSDDEVRRPHTEESIADPKTTPEEKAAWADYQIDLQRAEAEFKERLAPARVRLLATRGVRIVDYEEREKEWIEEHSWLGMAAPDEPRERLVHFFRFEVVGDSVEDTIGISKGICIASGIDPEVVAIGEASFRASLGEKKRADAEADTQAS
jgi:hypothetical protein